jgi:uncharacterized SAM-binding protein YcdF (DUF218 family)
LSGKILGEDMLQPAINFLKTALRPSSVFACLLLVLIGVLLLYSKRGPTRGRRWLIAVMIGYWIISTPLVAGLLVRGLANGYTAIEKAADLPDGSAIVVLGGGSFTFRAGDLTLDAPSTESAFRILEAARLYHLLGDPLVIASGGIVFPEPRVDTESEMIGKALITLGVPAQRIVYESNSRNTEEQAAYLKPLLQARHIDHFVIVTSPTHMERSLAVFRAQGLRPYLSVSRVRSDGLPDPWLLLPRGDYLHLSDEAIYEYLALGYYWVRGRL